MRDVGKVNIALKQDHPCLLLSIPHECKLLEMEKPDPRPHTSARNKD